MAARIQYYFEVLGKELLFTADDKGNLTCPKPSTQSVETIFELILLSNQSDDEKAIFTTALLDNPTTITVNKELLIAFFGPEKLILESQAVPLDYNSAAGIKNSTLCLFLIILKNIQNDDAFVSECDSLIAKAPTDINLLQKMTALNPLISEGSRQILRQLFACILDSTQFEQLTRKDLLAKVNALNKLDQKSMAVITLAVRDLRKYIFFNQNPKLKQEIEKAMAKTDSAKRPSIHAGLSICSKIIKATLKEIQAVIIESKEVLSTDSVVRASIIEDESAEGLENGTLSEYLRLIKQLGAQQDHDLIQSCNTLISRAETDAHLIAEISKLHLTLSDEFRHVLAETLKMVLNTKTFNNITQAELIQKFPALYLDQKSLDAIERIIQEFRNYITYEKNSNAKREIMSELDQISIRSTELDLQLKQYQAAVKITLEQLVADLKTVDLSQVKVIHYLAYQPIKPIPKHPQPSSTQITLSERTHKNPLFSSPSVEDRKFFYFPELEFCNMYLLFEDVGTQLRFSKQLLSDNWQQKAKVDGDIIEACQESITKFLLTSEAVPDNLRDEAFTAWEQGCAHRSIFPLLFGTIQVWQNPLSKALQQLKIQLMTLYLEIIEITTINNSKLLDLCNTNRALLAAGKIEVVFKNLSSLRKYLNDEQKTIINNLFNKISDPTTLDDKNEMIDFIQSNFGKEFLPHAQLKKIEGGLSAVRIIISGNKNLLPKLLNSPFVPKLSKENFDDFLPSAKSTIKDLLERIKKSLIETTNDSPFWSKRVSPSSSSSALITPAEMPPESFKESKETYCYFEKFQYEGKYILLKMNVSLLVITGCVLGAQNSLYSVDLNALYRNIIQQIQPLYPSTSLLHSALPLLVKNNHQLPDNIFGQQKFGNKIICDDTLKQKIIDTLPSSRVISTKSSGVGISATTSYDNLQEIGEDADEDSDEELQLAIKQSQKEYRRDQKQETPDQSDNNNNSEITFKF